MEQLDLIRIIKFLPGIILGLTVHEFSHAYVAGLCGDKTSEEQGRLTLNPLKHIDLLGFIMLMFVGFGWAKPVQFNENNLRNPKTDVIKIAIAGPVSNALLAIILSILYVIFLKFTASQYSTGMQIVKEMFEYGIYINWGLFIFNLIPVPPLDGSHLLLTWFKKYPALYEGLYKYGSWAFFGLIIAMLVTKIDLLPIWPAVQFLGNHVISLFNSIIG